MKKKKITLVILAVLVAAFGAAALWLISNPAESGDETAAAEGTGLLPFEKTGWETLAVTNEAGGYEAEIADGTVSIPALDGLPVSEDALSDLLSSVSTLAEQDVIADGEERLSEFGLEDPAASVTFTYDGGKTAEFSVGDSVPGQDTACRYVYMDGKVLVVYETQLTAFLGSEKDFLSLEVTPDYDSSSDSLTVESVSLSGSGWPDGFEVSLTGSQELSGVSVSSYQVSKPREYAADTTAAEEFLVSFFGLTADSVAEFRPNEAAISSYGLESPWVSLTLVYTSEGEAVTKNLRISEPDAEGNCAVTNDDAELIWTVSRDDLAWLSVTPESLYSRQIFTPDVTTLSKITIVTPEGEKTELTLVWEEDSYRVFAGDTEIEKENFQNFYYQLISLTADEIVFDGISGTEEMASAGSVTYEYREEGKEADTLTFFTETDRTYAAKLSCGTADFRLAASDVTEMADTLMRLAAGEEIKARY